MVWSGFRRAYLSQLEIKSLENPAFKESLSFNVIGTSEVYVEAPF